MIDVLGEENLLSNHDAPHRGCNSGGKYCGEFGYCGSSLWGGLHEHFSHFDFSVDHAPFEQHGLHL
jgi:hypothetical protein